jgi:DNA mismatch endonuclease (patch repair protein)
MERILKTILPNGFENVSQQRSKLMSRVRGKGNKSTELSLRLTLVRAGIRGWQMHPKSVVGCPDFYFPRNKLAVFVDGCFWHACKRRGHVPKTRSSFWSLKFARTRRRALKVAKKMRQQHIAMVRFWEHDIKRDPGLAVQKITDLRRLKRLNS